MTLPEKDGFHLRGVKITRLETFMDAAFAFATTMLIISVGEIPENYDELILALKAVPAFLVSFIVMMLFWSSHRTWSRRYGLEDKKVIIMSIGLIFVLLVYIYPLRLMFSTLFSWLSGGFLPSKFQLTSRSELIGLFAVYGFGLTAMAGLMTLLYLHAAFSKNILNLSSLEIIKTHSAILSWSIVSLTGLLSAILALLLPENIALISGFLYMTLPITIPLAEIIFKKREILLKREN